MKNLLLHIFDNDQKRKKDLIQQMKSKDNSVAINAVNTLRKKRDEQELMPVMCFHLLVQEVGQI